METVKGPDSKEQRIEHMVTLYQLPLLRLCIMYLHDEEQAKDVVQETFIKAYRNLDGFRADSSEKTWLTRIAINTCKNVYRSGWFRHVDRSVTLDMVAGHAVPTDTGDNELTTEIMNLPVKLREVALLCWLQGMTYDEAAATLGISPKAVGSRLNRARKKLRSALEGSDEHDPA
ncbi:MAG: sigma-70 family RNA polymerase sigma factor [Clostridiales bacterium]|nr:sigma-70 family RNA polymerase sigma factor [Clostridiales bacterium]